MATALKPPRLLELGIREAISALQRDELELRQHLRDFHQPLFRSFREDLRREFLSHFVVQLDHEDKKQQVWNPVAGDPLIPEMQNALDDVFDAAIEEDRDLFEEELDAAMEEGSARHLWLLTLGGLPGEDYADDLPDDETRRNLLLLAGIAGVTWLDRLQRWADEARDKAQRWVRGSIVSGSTLPETVDGFERIAEDFDAQVAGLMGNELHRAYHLGARTAQELVMQGHGIQRLWLARTLANGQLDPLVCPVCAALHLTVTDLEPIADTHPACRCMVVPIPDQYNPTPVTYTEFLNRLREREDE